MKFKEMIEWHKELQPAIDWTQGSTAFMQVARAWNTMAKMDPEQCEDVVVFHLQQPMSSIDNPLKKGKNVQSPKKSEAAPSD